MKSLYQIRQEMYDASLEELEKEKELEAKIDGKCDDPEIIDGTWLVRKNEDGLMEAWRTITANMTLGSAYGSYIHYQLGTSSWSLPSGFISIPHINCTPLGGELVQITVKDLTMTNFKLNFMRFTNSTSLALSNYPITIHAVGKWK